MTGAIDYTQQGRRPTDENATVGLLKPLGRGFPTNDAVIRYAVLAAAIFAALSPALFFSFGFHNDYNAWGYDAQSCCTHHPETLILNAIGRYFGAVAQNLQFLTITNLRSLWIWRLVGIGSAALLALFYLNIVSLGSTPSWEDVFLSCAVFTLPTMQFQAIWVSMYMFWTPPILLSLVAARVFIDAAQRRVTGSIAPWVTGFVALLAGLFFYPASATFVLAPTAHLLLARDSAARRRAAAAAVAALGGAFVALFFIHKFLVLPHMSGVPYLGEYEFSFASRVFSEAASRLRIYLGIGAYFWLGLELPWLPTVVDIATVVALVYLGIDLARRRIKVSTLTSAVLACGLFLVAAAPLVAVQQFSQTFRITFTMTAIELLLFFWLMKRFPVNTTALASVFAGLGIVLAFLSVYATAASAGEAHALYAQSVDSIARSPRSGFTAIVVLQPNRPRQAFGFTLRNDFGGLPPIHHIFDLLLGPRYSGLAAFDVTEFRLPPVDGVPIALEKDAVIIDASPLYGVPNFRNFSHRVGLVSAQPRGTIGPMYAVDGDPNSFWEVCGPSYSHPFPIEFKLELATDRKITGYSLSTLEETVRMPNAWEVWTTSDLQYWRLVQQVRGAGGWKTRETRHYRLENLSVVKGIKLVINGTDIGPCMRLYEFVPEDR
jgi:hypothetical protein